MKTINYRVDNTNVKMEKTQKWEKFFIYWKEKEIGEYIGEGLPKMVLNKFRGHQFKLNILFVRLKRNTPLKSFTVYDSFSHWCSCGPIVMDKENLISHFERQHEGITPKESQLNRPFWFDWLRLRTMI